MPNSVIEAPFLQFLKHSQLAANAAGSQKTHRSPVYSLIGIRSVTPLYAVWPLVNLFQNALKIIDDQASQLTRRSAGLPALVSAIVSSNPGGPLFQQVMHELHGMSRQPAAFDKGDELMKLPQVHAMNCLKDIFTTTRLRQSTEAFIMPALVIAAECLDSTMQVETTVIYEKL